MTHHSLDIRIYYEDTDAGGVVYHASYLRFAERGRTEFLRHIGYENSALAREFNLLFVVRHIEIDYLKPAVLDDLLCLDTSIEVLKKTSLVMRQKFFRNAEEGRDELVADMRVTIVCVDHHAIKPVRLPDIIREKFDTYI